ncbi:uncharacterized protein [Physcomitrium patens]|uniref:Uncharacterized protein n=1 Tax=Physcomitrium patens TaxID=3218 RepID=A0A2K1L6U7_PHYPA|nr:uncharacterized protein LOC112288603 [Physcomitrium patens]PNR61759.1 hypothetical protein PHYPA_000182 [Physcomitrium patens]|eukprot:XP_024388738.1 uncharacterized protein LOC112288603 [Physcomitrella patens]
MEKPKLKCHIWKKERGSPSLRPVRPPNPPPYPIKPKTKKRVGRKKAERGPLPSNKHADIEAPSMVIVERTLKPFKDEIKKWSVKITQRPRSGYHDDSGRMIIDGCSGGRYAGDVMGGTPNGVGQHWVTLSTGKEQCLYDGDWKSGCKTGNGTFYYTNGQEYRGGVLNGEHHGFGAMRFSNGDIYCGDWWKSRRHGLGKFFYCDGTIYFGRFVKDNRDGWGTNYWPDRRRKYEGEWNGDDPICGRWTTMTVMDFDSLANSDLGWPLAIKEMIKDGFPQEKVQVPFQGLRYPESVYFGKTSSMRNKRLEDMHEERVIEESGTKQVGSLRAEQMEALWHAFDELNPGYYRRTKLHFIHLRRLLLLARLNPDNEIGKELYAKLLQSAKETNGLSFNNLMHLMQSFHHPVVADQGNNKALSC